jgi:heat shock protein HslJ
VKKNLLILFILLLSLAVAACGAPATEEPSDSLDGAWKLTSLGPVNSPIPALTGIDAGITFNQDGTMAGTAGCNGFSGKYTVEGDQLTFSDIVSTLMACEEPVMQQEEIMYLVLTDTASFEIDGSTLTITNGDNHLVFTRTVSYPSYP